MTVMVTTKDKGRILAKFVGEFSPNGDITEFTVDTGRYWLAANKRAFGIRVKYTLNPWDSTEDLSLFLQDGKTLRQVVKDLTVRADGGRGCQSDHYDMTRTISITKLESNGLFDLIVRTKEARSEIMSLSDEGGCTFRETMDTSTHTLIYDGRSYVGSILPRYR